MPERARPSGPGVAEIDGVAAPAPAPTPAGRSRVWAVIIADIQNPFFTAMVRGIEDVAHESGHRLVLCNSDEDPEKEAAYVEIALAEGMAGVIVAVAWTGDSALDALLEHDIPVVAVDRRPAHLGDDVDAVVVDNRRGAADAAEHLVIAGATRFACITGPERASTATERAEGFEQALREAGIARKNILVEHADFREDGGYTAARRLLKRTDRPDALFVTNNLMTLGALRAIDEAGLTSPRDLLLVGFDDAPWTTLVRPRLSVVSQPAVQIGRRAAALLASARTERPKVHQVLRPILVVRESSVRAR